MPQDYFIELSLLVRNEFDLLRSWVKVLSYQIHVTSKVFQFTDLKILHHLAKIISKQVFDQFKSSQYLEFIYNRMRELGCDHETIVLSQQLTSSGKLSDLKTDNLFRDLNIQCSIDFIRNYRETGQMNFDNLELANVQVKSEIEMELYEDFLNLILIHSPKNVFNDILNRFDDSIKFVNRLKCLGTRYRWDHLIEGTEIYKLHLLYLKVIIQKSIAYLIYRENSRKH